MVALFDASAPGSVLTAAGTRLTDSERAIQITGLQFSWGISSATVLDIVGLQVDKGQRVFIEGPSGSGKSTLLGLLAGIVTPRSGCITVLGRSLDAMSGAARDRFRSDHMGIIFQMFNLIPYLSVVDNVTLPCRFSYRRLERAGRNGGVATEAARLLSRLGMNDPTLLKRPVTELSVGQQQRVAAARALMGAPELIIADEPTSALDADHRLAFIELLFQECQKAKSTLLFASHDTALASLFDRTVQLRQPNRTGRERLNHEREER